jgi:ABC-type glycerol-3-phosphate transport system substrate-binding protein
MRQLAALLMLMALTAACSSKSASSATTTKAPPPAVTTTTTLPANDGLSALGATSAEWDAKHTPDPSKVSVAGRPTAYLPAVNGSGDEYSSVIQANGRVSAYHITFPTPMSLTAAEAFLAARLPPRTQP